MSIAYATKVGACKHCSKPLDPTNFFTNHGLVINGRNAHEFCDDECAWKRGVCFDCEEDLLSCECGEVTA